jgi:nitrogen PTS system EIIA component
VYLNLVQIAESFGVTEKVVEGWVRDEAMPHTLDRGRLLFDRAQVVQWAATRGLAAQVGYLAPEAGVLATSLQLGPLLRVGGIWRDVPVADVSSVFARVANALPGVTPPVRRMLEERLRSSGGVSLAPIGGGFALPHPAARITLGRDAGAVALILLREPLDAAALRVDDVPVTRLVFFIAPSPRAHLELIGQIARLLVGGTLRDVLAGGGTDEEIFRAVEAADAARSGAPGPRGTP